MNPEQNAARNMVPGKNRGAALLVLLLAIVLIFGSVVIAALAGNNPEIARRQKTIEALSRAKQGLIAWSVAQGDMWPVTKLVNKKDDAGNDIKVEEFTYYRPGTLPCPDRSSPDDASAGGAQGSCSASGGTSIGRLPWKTLGLEKLVDSSGETLWYAVSNKFRLPNTNSAAINSDTQGTLLLYAADGTTLMTPPGEELAAIIFAPGPPLPGQDRGAEPTNAAHYLEAFNGKNNASSAGPFITGPVRDANGNFVTNDLVMGLGARELLAAIEKRALTEAQNALAQFTELPRPAPYNGSNCLLPVTDVKSLVKLCTSDAATCAGRLPEEALEPYVAKWFTQNGWGRVMIYAINDASCASPLKVGGHLKNYVLFAPGTPRQGQTRPSTSLADYLENEANTSGWSGNLDFAIPDGDSNDQLRTDP